MNEQHPDTIDNVLYEDIELGQSARLIRTLTPEDIRAFAAVSGDVNPAHLDTSFANDSMFHGVIGHGMWTGSLVSTILGTQFPGPGTIYLEQSFRFKRPVRIGDTLTVEIVVVEKHDDKHTLVLECTINNQHGERVVSGEAKVMAPTEKIVRPRMQTPKLNVFDPQARIDAFIASLDADRPVRAAVVHPTHSSTLTAALNLRETGCVIPILVGPRSKIEAVAAETHIDLSVFELIDVKHSHEAAACAAQLAETGDVDFIQRGNLEKQELLEPIDTNQNLHTKFRRSHISRFDIPLYSKPLFLTDAVLNLKPTLLEKANIIQNAVNTAHILGIETPHVAILSAVDIIDADYPSSLDAAALCKMHDRGQIQGGRLDGPLKFDHAVTRSAEGDAPYPSVAADILAAPDNESANMLAKQLEFFAGASHSGVIVGARIPIAMPMRNASVQSQMLSGVFAACIAQHYKTHTP
jgi:phosphate acetyltransferase